MKPSSPDGDPRRPGAPARGRPAPPRTQDPAAGLSQLPDGRPGVLNRDVRIRPARLDRQLGQGKIDPTYSDTHLEVVVRRAAQQAREEARAEGYAAGWAQGRQAAAEQLREDQAAQTERMAARQEADGQRVRTLIAGLGEAIIAARRATIPDWEEVADVLADGALRLARAALARELRSIDEPVALAVRQALEAIADPGEAVVHLHPDDAALAGTSLPEGLRVVPDPTVPAGAVVVLTPSQRLRMDLPSALAAAERVLRS
jgi:flagellar assembly protein FliH